MKMMPVPNLSSSQVPMNHPKTGGTARTKGIVTKAPICLILFCFSFSDIARSFKNNLQTAQYTRISIAFQEEYPSRKREKSFYIEAITKYEK